MKQMQRNIELIRYRRFGPGLLMLDLVAATSTKGAFIDTKGTLLFPAKQHKRTASGSCRESCGKSLASRSEHLKVCFFRLRGQEASAR